MNRAPLSRQDILLRIAIILAVVMLTTWMGIAVGTRLPVQSSADSSEPTEPYAESWQATINHDAGIMTVDGVVVNPTERPCAYLTVRVPCYDEREQLVGYASDQISDLPGYGRWRFRAVGFGMQAAQVTRRPQVFGH